MDIEITNMSISDFEKIEENLIQDFDDFWTPNSLKEELENKKRIGLTLHSRKTKS